MRILGAFDNVVGLPFRLETDLDTLADDNEVCQQLRVLVGDAVFERGQRALGDGRVGPLAQTSGRVTAVVDGPKPHTASVRKTARGFDGNCDCPASDGFDFCAHCVAVALAAEQRDAARRQALTGTPEDRLLAYLNDRSHTELVDLLAGAARQFEPLRERLQLRSDVAIGAVDLRALKKRVTAALPLRDVWQRAKVRAYFSHAVAALTDLVEIADVVPPETLLGVSEYAIERLVRVLERVDDSDGHRWFVQDRIRDLYGIALERSDMTPAARAEHLLHKVLTDPTDAFNAGAADFVDALGTAGTDAFYRIVRERLVAGAPDDRDRARLRGILRDHARANDDIDALIELQRSDCRTAQDHYRLAELYLEKADLDAALETLCAGDTLAGAERRNLDLRMRVHRAREEWADAVDAQREALMRAPSLDQYDTLAQLADRLGTRQAVMRRAENTLARQLSAGHPNRNAAATVLARTAWDRGERERAFNVAVEHITDVDTLLPMIDGLRDDQIARAAQLFDCAVEATIAQKKNGAYRSAVKLIHTYRDLFDELGPGMFDAFLSDLRERHRPKRNLMMLLDHLVAESAQGPDPH